MPNNKIKNIVYQIATLGDVDGILALQHKYHIDSIQEKYRADGFVTTPFSKEQLVSLINLEQGLFVAKKDNQVVAYLMAASWDFWSAWEMFRFMIDGLSKLKYLGQEINTSNSYQYGPICIDSSVRGSGLLEEFFDFSREVMSHKYPILITFVNKNNPRSIAAHTKKLGLEVICEFEFNNNQYLEMVYDTTKQVHS